MPLMVIPIGNLMGMTIVESLIFIDLRGVMLLIKLILIEQWGVTHFYGLKGVIF